MFRHYAAFKHMTVFGNVAFGLQIRKQPKDKIQRRVTELLELVHLEPYGVLDAQVRKELRTWLRRLHDEVHVTTGFVTHDQEEAMEVADTIVVMAGGQVQQVGSPDDLYERPASDFVMSFLGPVTRLGGALVRPHDLEVLAAPGADGSPARVVRVARLGFEVRLDLVVDGVELWARVTRDQAARLDLRPGGTVHVRRARQHQAA